MTFPGAAEGRVTSYVIDPGKSRFSVKATAGGLFAFAGHNPTIAIRDFTGEVRLRPEVERSSLRMEIDPNSLAITGEINEKDRREMERIMREDVLETARFPEIRFESSEIIAETLTDAYIGREYEGP